ncbi:hypothetical protein [Mycolicibacterium sp.]|uniref:hypothetical protein n=1 Tax=Mycolicibacterium sp. TaxID=2320850 RepID=UPI0037CB8139
MTETSVPNIDVLDATQKLGAQLVSTVKQSQAVTLDVLRSLTEGLPSVPSVDKLLDGKSLPDASAFTEYGFDLVADLLAAQKDFAVKLAQLSAGRVSSGS